MEQRIITLYEKCVACKSCEIACAVEHSASKTLFGALFETPRSKPRVHVQNAGAYSYPSQCRHCEDAACIQSCPTGAMQRNSSTHAVFVDTDRCIGCWMCMMGCPFGAITSDAEGTHSHKCDLCPDRLSQGSKPACVEACPTRALQFMNPDTYSSLRRQEVAADTVSEPEEDETPAQFPQNMIVYRTFKGVAP